jgi:ubiquilin
MGAPPSEEQITNMMSDPATAQALNEALDNPQFLDHLISTNPYLRSVPNAREMLRSPALRNMISNPEYMRAAMRLQRQMGGGPFGASAFPAPGATDTTPAGAPASGSTGANTSGQAPAQNPWAGMDPFAMFGPGSGFGGVGAGANPPTSPFAANPQGNPFAAGNPFASLFTPPPQSAPAASAQTGGDTTQRSAEGSATAAPAAPAGSVAGATGTAQNPPPPNPFASLFNPANVSPEMMAQMMQLFGGMGAPPPQPQDNRPPEERYADQLRQLNDMGFFDFDRNIAALRRSGGSVQGAIEHLLND